MKFTLVRFKEDKRPLCVLGGHLDERNVFDAIDEWHDPIVCEYTYVEISKYCFGLCWHNGAKTFKENGECYNDEIDNSYCYSGNVEFGSSLLMELINYFESEDSYYTEWLSISKSY